ncbi:MAG: alpha/beta hydrolase [Gammaproteobacteria bacterium]|jgi:pimeloyl-ACP methyl ester carboxylesterase|nr:alpha/beta hydrolase [Gammaproteobacteria bacterium]MBT6074848.1 alpha/beta hydrolase [Gammaproteobacteria bacterium]MBT7753427.1 alpha/beta hydrolase [Gammaproteobacteria bacterium]MDG2435113.1 alpha/beta hydrolase [Gammaproteobacteria bacterium]
MVKKIIRKTSFLILIALFVFAISLLFGARYPQDISPETIESKYLLRSSSFINIDGVKIHFTDEGNGPVLLLLHANYANLIDWDPWVQELSATHRIIRLDIPGHGLSYNDPSGDYSMARTLFLLQKLMDHLEINSFSIAGASLGGTIGLHYASNYSNEVNRLILVSPGALNPRVRGSNEPPHLPKLFNLLTQITPRALVEGLLTGGFGDPSKISEELVTRWHELLLKEGQRDAQMARMKQYISGDIDQIIQSIEAPVLIMWGKKNKVVSVALATEMKNLLVNSPSVEMIIYKNAGHQLVQEIGSETAKDALRYLLENN